MTRTTPPPPPAEDPPPARRRHPRHGRVGPAQMAARASGALKHWLAHLEVFGPGQPSGWLDLVAGYPTGALLLITGAILAGRRRPTSKSTNT